MQNWQSRESFVTDSPFSSLPSIGNDEIAQTGSTMNMSISTDYDDAFFDLSHYQKERSASFGGATQYSQQMMREKMAFSRCFDNSLETLDSGTRDPWIFQTNYSSATFLLREFPNQIKLPPSPSPPPSSSSLSGPFEHHPYHLPANNNHLTSLFTISPSSVFPALSASILNSCDSSSSSTTSSNPEDVLMMDLMDNGAETSSSASTSTSSVSHFGTDAFMTTPDDVMMADDMEPVPRDRCNTWPMRRPQLDPPAHSSPLIHEQIPEEDSDLFGSSEQCGRLGGSSTNGSTAMLHSPDGSGHPASFSSEISDSPGMNDDPTSANSKKTTTRKNAWGNMSYAELITTAIHASPEKRLTLAQIYEWMVQNVPYFRDKGDSNSSAGWKVKMNDSLDDDFEPEPRGRCYTWPMQHFVYQEQPLPPHLPHHHHNPYLPQHHHMQQHPQLNLNMTNLTSSGSSVASSIGGVAGGGGGSPSSNGPPSCQQLPQSGSSTPVTSPQQQTVGQMLAASVQQPCSSSGMTLGMSLNLSQGGGPMPAKKKRCRKKPTDQLAQKKPNPWGEESYSDIIAKALESSPDGRLKLNEIYQWFSDNIPYFRERSTQEEAAGWKNSIRHNLSLHARFMRIQNEGAGKSSWWVINPDARPGRNPRRTRERSNTIESTTKAQLEKSRRGAKKRVKDRSSVLGSIHSGINGANSLQSIQSDLYDDDTMPGSFESFRGRTHSNISVPGSSSRVSPAVNDLYDDLDGFPSWVGESVPNIPSDIVDRTDQMRIDATTHLNGTQIKQEAKPIKTEPIAPPPSYHELNSVRGPCAQNPLLRNPIVPSTNFKPMPLPGTYGSYQNGGSWASPMGPNSLPGIQSCGVAAQHNAVSSSSALPMDLENLTLPEQPLMDMDVEAMIRHELSQSGAINFD
uniref:Forkhead box protein O n=1 Tax=Caenorhabditis japonica TaxID=281687 RepID=A0A8R1HNW9_CAEJA